MVQVDNTLARNLVSAREGSARLGFETQFNQLQSTVVNRLNTQISKISDTDNTLRKREALERDFKVLRGSLPIIQAFKVDNQANLDFLADISDAIAAVVNALISEDDNTNVTAGEVIAFDTAKADLVAKMDKLLVIAHPNFILPDVIGNLTRQISDISALTVVAGVIDPEGAEPTTNVNRPTVDALNTLQAEVVTASAVTTNTINLAGEVETDLVAKASKSQTDRIELLTVEERRKDAEIELLRQKFGILLEAISLTFEANQSRDKELRSALFSTGAPPPGSVLNLFT